MIGTSSLLAARMAPLAIGAFHDIAVPLRERLARGSGKKAEARSFTELASYLRRKGVTIRSVTDDEFATNSMLWGFAEQLAHKHSADLSEDIKRGIASRVKAGKPWGTPRYGFRKKEDGHWEANPDEARLVRRIFKEHVERGLAYNAIAQRLNGADVPTRNGGKWTANTIKRILTDRSVLGEFWHKGAYHEGTHDPIIDQELFDQAQTIAANRKKNAPGEGRGGRIPKRHVFTRGMLRCRLCGEAMLPRSASDQEDVYVCRTHKQTGGAAACPMPPVKRTAVDDAFYTVFSQGGIDIEATRQRVAEQLNSQIGEVEAQAARARREAEELREQERRVTRDYRNGELTGASYEQIAAAIREELSAAEAESQRLTEHEEAMRRTSSNIDAEDETLRALAELEAQIRDATATGSSQGIEALRAAIATIFEVVYIEPGQNGGWPYLFPQVREELFAEEATPVALGLSVPENKLSASGVPE